MQYKSIMTIQNSNNPKYYEISSHELQCIEGIIYGYSSGGDWEFFIKLYSCLVVGHTW
jgi:hypothetical protein